ncbi:MAG: histidinol dehydrogenase [Lachnospiraceae bacterium]|nr:histidinol dehydrogenase [Lachnospiraceae bacterium]
MIRIIRMDQEKRKSILARKAPDTDVSGIVSGIIENVKTNGDKALYDYTEQFDKVRPESLQVTEEEMTEALAAVDPAFLDLLRRAAKNIRAFHEKQVREDFQVNERPGVTLMQRVIPVDRAGLYVPGGTAAYPSTVLMDAIPAKIAGVKEVVITTPPDKNGKISPVILAASSVAGVDRIYKVGGAQAIAALAYGTETIPKVDKIVGPGNAFVAEAKKQVFGQVSIDMIAGPSEILIISDGKTNPAYIAADLLSQAEHDKMASAVLLTDDEAFAKEVQNEIELQLTKLKREEIARESVERNGKIIITGSIEEAVEVANEIAPEHLELAVENPFGYLPRIRHAGSVFMGRYCPEALGDYFAGPNHTLPTGGTARFSSPLSVDDFVKKMQVTYYTKEALDRDAKDVAYFAELEGLTGHARSALIRTEEES